MSVGAHHDSVRPRDAFPHTHTAPPDLDALVADLRDDTHAFCHRVEIGMAEKTPSQVCKVVETDIENHKRVRGMTKPRFAEIGVLREKTDPPLAVQNRQNVRVVGAADAPVVPKMPHLHAHPSQQRGLVFGKIFVEQIHAACLRGVAACQSAWASTVRRASSTASAIAGSDTRPPHRTWLMKSHDFPAATSARTWWTMMRVPRNVGFPWHTRGLAMMYRPSSTMASLAALFFAAFIGRRLIVQTLAGKTAFR